MTRSLSELADALTDFAESYEAGGYPRIILDKAAATLRSAEGKPLTSAPVAWLYTLGKPGFRTEFASVDSNDTTHWPKDQWTNGYKVQPLYLAAEGKAYDHLLNVEVTMKPVPQDKSHCFKHACTFPVHEGECPYCKV